MPARIFAREKINDFIFAVQIPAALRIRAGKPRAPHPLRRRHLGGEIASRIAGGALGVRQPQRLVFGRDAQGHDARAVGTLKLRLQLRQPAVERENETRRLRFEREFFEHEVRVHLALGFEHSEFLAQKERHALARQFHRATKQIAPLRRQTHGLQHRAAESPKRLARDQYRMFDVGQKV